MSAQDHTVPTAAIDDINYSALAGSSALIARHMKQAVFETARRHRLWKLNDLNADQLDDLGLNRDVLMAALTAPLSVSAADMLSRARVARSRAGV